MPRPSAKPTRAYHLRRADYLEMKEDREGAARERELAAAQAPEDAFDHFLLGREQARKSDWNAAFASFEFVTRQQPEHFWRDVCWRSATCKPTSTGRRG